MKRLMIICVVAGIVLSVSPLALAATVALTPSTLNVTRGSTVTVSVDMAVDADFTMTAISAVVLYDAAVFTYVDNSVAQGAFLKDDWTGGMPMGAAGTPGEFRVSAIDWTDFGGELLAAGSGTLFTFTLLANVDAPQGLSPLTFDPYVGGDNPTSGFVYGNADFIDVILLDSEMSGASVNVTPEPMTLALLGLGGLILRRRKG